MGQVIKNYGKYLEKYKQRNKEIIELRKDGKSFKEIADIHKISIERARQILRKYGKNVDESNLHKIYKCKCCGEEIFVPLKSTRHREICDNCRTLKRKYNTCYKCGKKILKSSKACRKCTKINFLHDKTSEIVKWYLAGYSTIKIAKFLTDRYADKSLNTMQVAVHRILRDNNIKCDHKGIEIMIYRR